MKITPLASLALVALPAPAAAQNAAASRALAPRHRRQADRSARLFAWRLDGVGGLWERMTKQAGAPPFRAVVALYPYCPKVAPPLASDLLILIGDADDWASATQCVAYVDKYGADAPHWPLPKVYPGARHSFDAKRPERVYFGHHLAYDAKATADALVRTRQFFDEHLNAKP